MSRLYQEGKIGSSNNVVQSTPIYPIRNIIDQISLLHSTSTETPTDYKLVRSIINSLDIDWKNPNITINDPVCGRGTFLLAALERLEAEGHSREHAVKNMLFGTDVNSVQSRIAAKALKMASGVEPNIYCKDSLARTDDMKFDAVLMNPPYQKDTNFKKDEDNKQGSFWYQFVELGINKLKDDSTLVVICPKSIFGSGGFGTKAFKVGQMVNDISFTDIWPDLSDHFKVSIEILGFVAVKNKSRPPVRIVGTNDTVTIDGTIPVPFYVSKTAVSVIKKCFNVSGNTIGFKEKIQSASASDAVLKVNGGRFKQWKKTYVGVNSGTKHNQQGAVIKNVELPGYTSAVNSELWEFIFKVMGGEKGNSVTGLMDRLPIMPDMTKEYTNDEWYKAFGVTDQEQADIQQFLKDYK
jgi:hypothetical protein